MKKINKISLILLLFAMLLSGCSSNYNPPTNSNNITSNPTKRNSTDNINNYSICGQNQTIKIDEITMSELEKIDFLIQPIFHSTARTNANSFSISDFNKIKPISEIKIVKTDNKNYCYNIFTVDNKKLALFYEIVDDSAIFDFAVFFDSIKSYDELFSNEKISYGKAKALGQSLYSDRFNSIYKLCTSLLFNKINVTYGADDDFSFVTDRGFLYIDYDNSTQKSDSEMQILNFELLSGDYVELCKSLIENFI